MLLFDHRANAELVADHIAKIPKRQRPSIFCYENTIALTCENLPQVAGFHNAKALRARVRSQLQSKIPQTPRQSALFAAFESPFKAVPEERAPPKTSPGTPRLPNTPNSRQTPSSANTTPRHSSGRCASVPVYEDSGDISMAINAAPVPRTPRRNGAQELQKSESGEDQRSTFFGSLILGLKETANVKKTDPKGWIGEMQKRNSHLEAYCKQLELQNNKMLLQLSCKLPGAGGPVTSNGAGRVDKGPASAQGAGVSLGPPTPRSLGPPTPRRVVARGPAGAQGAGNPLAPPKPTQVLSALPPREGDTLFV